MKRSRLARSRVLRKLHRLRRQDSGTILIESIVAIALVSVILTSLTTVLVTGTRATAQQRGAQAAAQISTAALDLAQRYGGAAAAGGSLGTPVVNVVNGTEFTTTYTVEDCTLNVDGTSCVANPGGTPGDSPFVLVTATTTWNANTCPTGGCSDVVHTVLNTSTSAVFGSSSPPVLADTITGLFALEGKPVAGRITATNAIAPPLLFAKGAARAIKASQISTCRTSTSPVGLGSWNVAVDTLTGTLSGIVPTVPTTPTDTNTGIYCLNVSVADAHQQAASKNYVVSVTPNCLPDFDGQWQTNTPEQIKQMQDWLAHKPGSYPPYGYYAQPAEGQVLGGNGSYNGYWLIPKNTPNCLNNIEYTVTTFMRQYPSPSNLLVPWLPGVLKCGDYTGDQSGVGIPANSSDTTITDKDINAKFAVNSLTTVYYCRNTTGHVYLYNLDINQTYCLRINMKNTTTGESTRVYSSVKISTSVPASSLPSCESVINYHG